MRWNAHASQLGLVIGGDERDDRSWLVMWSIEDRSVRFSWHLADALLVVDSTTVPQLQKRRGLTP